MTALAPASRYELLCIADARLSNDLGLDALIAAAERLEAFVVHGHAKPLPILHGELQEAVAAGDYSGTTARDWLPTLQAGEPAPVASDSLPAPAPAEADDLQRQLDAVYAQLQDAVEKGLPCPRNVDLGGLVKLPAGWVIGKLRDTGRIEIETRGCKRRVGIGGRWTLWTGEAAASDTLAEPAADPLNSAVIYLRSRGFTVVKIAGDWLLNDRDVTPQDLIAKAEQVRTRSEDAKSV